MDNNSIKNAPPIIKDFLSYLQIIKGKSEKTVLEYYLDLRTFFRYIKRSKNLTSNNVNFDEICISDVNIDLVKSLTLTDIYEYLNFTMSERGNHAATRARKVSSLRTFFKYLTNKTHQLNENPAKELDTPKLKSSLPKFLTLEQSQALIKNIYGPFKERDYCILVLFLNCGMRLSELVSINLSDIRTDGTLKILGKGNKERIIYLNKACQEAIQIYLKKRPNDALAEKNALFISKFKKRISNKTVQHLVYKYLAAIGLKGQGYSVHKLRHTAATLMYRHGHVDIRILKEILGHESVGTTEIYTHVANEQLKNALDSNPLNKV